MKWTNPSLYLLAALLTLGPAGWRILSWSATNPQSYTSAQAVAGETLFKHEWTPNDSLCIGGDGLGPVFNANSCVACHNQGGVGGGGGLKHNVNAFVRQPIRLGEKLRQGVVHASATRPEYVETFRDIDPALPPLTRPTFRLIDNGFICGNDGVVATKSQQISDGAGGVTVIPANISLSQRNTPALFGARLIDEIPERVIIAQARSQHAAWGMTPSSDDTVPVGRVVRLGDGRIGRFGWQSQSGSLLDFVQAACANELGLSNPGQKQPAPMGRPNLPDRGLDLSSEQCVQLTAFISSLRKPAEIIPDGLSGEVEAGKSDFTRIGCASCHTPSLGSVDGIYSDLLLHRMGQDLVGGGSYGSQLPPTPEQSPGDTPLADEWRTPPLWGVADSAPYLHDGRAETLVDAIRLHAGQAGSSVQRFNQLSERGQNRVVAFLKTLRAP